MTKKRTADKVQDFAFDDDTSDSDEEGLGDFQAKVGLLKQDTRSKRSLPLETGACDTRNAEKTHGSEAPVLDGATTSSVQLARWFVRM